VLQRCREHWHRSWAEPHSRAGWPEARIESPQDFELLVPVVLLLGRVLPGLSALPLAHALPERG
jgi:hypothetical protein